MRKTRVILFIALALAGCTFSGVKPEMVTPPPPEPPKVFVMGEIQIKDALWERYKLHFTRGVTDWLREERGFESVLTERPSTLPERSMVLFGTITEVDKGSTALRWIVGMGAGQAQVKGDFELRNASGTVVARFSARESYLGGAGIGGAGFLDMEDLVRRFAETVAKTALKVARGQKIGDSETSK